MPIDAPLGRPQPLEAALARHRAGTPIEPEPNDAFHRSTDAYVRRITLRRPLEIGADKIARATHRALRLFGDLRTATGMALPLASHPGFPAETSVIEVYPALNLLARGIPEKGDKSNKPGAQERRVEIARHLSPQLASRFTSTWRCGRMTPSMRASACSRYWTSHMVRPGDPTLRIRWTSRGGSGFRSEWQPPPRLAFPPVWEWRTARTDRFPRRASFAHTRNPSPKRPQSAGA